MKYVGLVNERCLFECDTTKDTIHNSASMSLKDGFNMTSVGYLSRLWNNNGFVGDFAILVLDGNDQAGFETCQDTGWRMRVAIFGCRFVEHLPDTCLI